MLALAGASVGAAPAHASIGDLGAYLRARVAAADGLAEASARDYSRAMAQDPANPVVAIRAYREGIRAGDLQLADRAMAVLEAANVAPPDAAIMTLARAAEQRDAAGAHAAIARLRGGQLAILAAPLSAWLALEAGGDPLASLAARPADAVARRFAEETRALILIAQGKTADGIAALHAVLGNDQASQDNRITAARLLIGQGKVEQARSLLVGNAPAIAALRASLDKGERKGATPSFGVGASHLFTRIASDLAVGPPGPLSFVLTRAALRADPTNDRARLLLAGALARDGATDRALAVLADVPSDSAHAPGATTGRIQILAAADRDREAVEVAKNSVDGGGDAAVERLADLYLRLDRADDAVPLYRRLAEQGDAGNWARWLQYGAAAEQAGDWGAARPALEKALALAPNEPLVLNHLGYSLVEHRERMADAQAMLEKAARLRPDDAAITDSLGWSFYLRGQHARALPLIEQAAAADPTNAEIGEHLGDAYWTAGRRFEARHAWTAARVTAEPDAAARLSGKIANGL